MKKKKVVVSFILSCFNYPVESVQYSLLLVWNGFIILLSSVRKETLKYNNIEQQKRMIVSRGFQTVIVGLKKTERRRRFPFCDCLDSTTPDHVSDHAILESGYKTRSSSSSSLHHYFKNKSTTQIFRQIWINQVTEQYPS